MSAPPRYSIIFNGELLPGVRRNEALEKISLLTNLDAEELLDSLFSVKPVIICYVDDRDLAEGYLESFQNAGLALTLEPYDEAHDEIINAEISFSHYAPIARQETAPNYLIDETPLSQEGMAVDEQEMQSKSGPSYRIIFNGEFGQGVTKEEAVENICHLTNTQRDEVVEQIFSVVPVILIETPDLALAQSHQKEFMSAGLLAELKEEETFNEALAISGLQIRTDAPPPPSKKTIPQFVYILLGLAAASTLLWGGIYISNKGFFDQEIAPTLDVKLDYAKLTPAEPVSEAEPDIPVEEIEELIVPEIKKKPIEPPTTNANDVEPKGPKMAKEAPITKPALPTPQPTSPPKEVKQRPSNLASLSDKQTVEIEQEYFIELLNWFAQPQHHSYDSETRKLNLEGEIKIKITIHRDGKVESVEVLSSSSEQLSRETKASALKAAPYPKVPKEITGELYRFTLPLKYTLEGQ